MRTKLLPKLGGMLMLALVCASGCKKENNTAPEPSNTPTSMLKEGDQSEDAMLLGEQLPNPYAYENMMVAFDNIKSDFPAMQSPVRITHNYTKINVKDELQLSILKQDESMILYSYPLDYDIVQNGTYFRYEEGQCDSCVTAQFSSVSVEKQLPQGIESEILAQLYIPEEDEELQQRIGADVEAEVFEDALVNEAFRLVGLDIKQTPGHAGQLKTTASKWTPAGKIRVWDDYTNVYVPVEGVEVRARRWFTTHRGLTNVNGDYTCDGQFKNDANYSLQWDRHHFSIRSGTYGQAVYNGPKKEGNWNLDLSSNPQMFYARIFRAAYQYYYKNIDGLTRPPLNDNIFDPQLKIAAYNESNSDINGVTAPWKRFLGLGNFIKLYNPGNNIRAIHGTTIHELGHAVHWKICSPKSNYNGSDDIVAESWARGVQWYLTRKYYPTYTPFYNNTYTGVVEDMMDGTNGYDQVAGYSIVEIENGVKNKKTWNDWKNNMKNLYNNATENNLDNLFSYWD